MQMEGGRRCKPALMDASGPNGKASLTAIKQKRPVAACAPLMHL